MPERAPIHWVVVADASRAQIFESDLMFKELMAVDSRVHPQSRMPVRELVSGDRGATNAGPEGVQSRFERHSDPHRMAIDVFARELAELLRQARIEGRYQRLVLVAPPVFLGALRSHLDGESTRRVVTSLAYDWVTLSTADLAARLREATSESTLPPHA